MARQSGADAEENRVDLHDWLYTVSARAYPGADVGDWTRMADGLMAHLSKLKEPSKPTEPTGYWEGQANSLRARLKEAKAEVKRADEETAAQLALREEALEDLASEKRLVEDLRVARREDAKRAGELRAQARDLENLAIRRGNKMVQLKDRAEKAEEGNQAGRFQGLREAVGWLTVTWPDMATHLGSYIRKEQERAEDKSD